MDTMNSELNGTVLNGEADYRNMRWAEDLANAILQQGGEVDGFQLPLDILTVVAEILAGDNDLSPLAQLNAVSRSVHEATLPVLYESVNFDDEQAVEWSSGLGEVNKGFKYTKFLLATEITLPLVRMMARYHSRHLPNPSTNLKHVFPRLALVGLTSKPSMDTDWRNNPHLLPVHVTLYRPLSLPEVLRSCLPRGRFSYGSGVKFFGTYYYDDSMATNRTKPKKFRDIVGLTIEQGAYLGPAKGGIGMDGWYGHSSVGMDGWQVASSEGTFHLELNDEVAGWQTKESLRRVLDHLAVYVQSLPGSKQDAFNPKLSLKCSSQVLELFVELFRDKQPCYLDLNVDITTCSNVDTIQRCTVALAEAYSLHWRHQPLRINAVFAEMTAPSDHMPPRFHGADILASEETGAGWSAAVEGRLVFGHDDALGNTRPPGFTARVAGSVSYRGRSGHTLIAEAWRHAYPLAHIPFEIPSEEEMQRVNPVAMAAVLLPRLAGGDGVHFGGAAGE